MLAAAVAGLVVGRPMRAAAVWLVPLVIVGSTVLLQGETRLRAGVEPFLLLLAALACERLVDTVATVAHRPPRRQRRAA